MVLKQNRNYHLHNKQNIIVIWQAKAACTSVIHMLFKEDGLLDEALRYSKWIHNFREKHEEEEQKKRIKAILTRSTRYIQFCVNPYRRAVSSYIHAMRHDYLHPRHKIISFHTFIQSLLDGNILANIHHDLQSFILANERNIEYIKMEELKEKLPYIINKYKLNYKINQEHHHNPMEKNSYNNTDFIGNHKWNDIKNAIPTHYKVFYNKEIKEKVSKLYEHDLKTLGYTWKMFLNTNV